MSAETHLYTHKRSPKPADSNPINLKILNIIESYTQVAGVETGNCNYECECRSAFTPSVCFYLSVQKLPPEQARASVCTARMQTSTHKLVATRLCYACTIEVSALSSELVIAHGSKSFCHYWEPTRSATQVTSLYSKCALTIVLLTASLSSGKPVLPFRSLSSLRLIIN